MYSGATLLAVLIGVVIGALGLLLPVAIGRVRNGMIREHSIQMGMLAVGLSTVFVVAALFVCRKVAIDMLPAFGMAVIVAFLSCTAFYSIRTARMLRR